MTDEIKKQQLAAVCYGAVDLRLETRPIPSPGPDEALIEICATGLCGSDLHYYTHGANGAFKIIDPMVLGHEACGIVRAVGRTELQGGPELQVGDKVALEVGVYCKTCRFCKVGRYNLCQNMRFRSSAKVHPHFDGTLTEFITHPVDLCHRIPSSLRLPLASLAEPLSVVLHAFRRAHLTPGAKILVLGVGPVGLLTCALARASGCTTILGVDIDENKLSLGKELDWATSTYALPRGPRVTGAEAGALAQRLWANMRDHLISNGNADLEGGFDAVFECTGVESCMQLAVHAALPGSKVVYVGMGTANLSLPTAPSLIREVDLIGVFRYANTYPEALALLASGKLGDVRRMISHVYELKDAVKAFEDMKRGRDDTGKPMIKPVIGKWNLQ